MKSVEQFKTNSHIIPRWIMREIKVGQSGQFHRLLPDGVDQMQKDEMRDFVCADCEILFAEDDALGAAFIRQAKYLISSDERGEIHSAEGKQGISRFIISESLRAHLFEITNGETRFLGELFEPFRANYLNQKINERSFIIRAKRYSFLPNKVSLPNLTEGEGFLILQMHVLGYNFELVLKAPAPLAYELEILRQDFLFVQKDDSLDNPTLSYIRELYAKGRR